MNDITHEQFRDLRISLELTQQEVADAFGVTRKAVSIWEGGGSGTNATTRPNQMAYRLLRAYAMGEITFEGWPVRPSELGTAAAVDLVNGVHDLKSELPDRLERLTELSMTLDRQVRALAVVARALKETDEEMEGGPRCVEAFTNENGEP